MVENSYIFGCFLKKHDSKVREAKIEKLTKLLKITVEDY